MLFHRRVILCEYWNYWNEAHLRYHLFLFTWQIFPIGDSGTYVMPLWWDTSTISWSSTELEGTSEIIWLTPWFCTIQIIPFLVLHPPEFFHAFVPSERLLSIYCMLSTRLGSEAAVLNTMPSLTSRCLEIWEETDVHTAMM